MFTCFCGMFRLLLTTVQIPVAQAHSTSYELTVTHQHVKEAKHMNHFLYIVEQKRNVMAHAQKPDLVFQRNGRVHLYRRGCQFSRLLAAEVCASAE